MPLYYAYGFLLAARCSDIVSPGLGVPDFVTPQCLTTLREPIVVLARGRDGHEDLCAGFVGVSYPKTLRNRVQQVVFGWLRALSQRPPGQWLRPALWTSYPCAARGTGTGLCIDTVFRRIGATHYA